MRHKPANPLLKKDWFVDTVPLSDAQEIVSRLHYSRGSSNTATYRHGLFSKNSLSLAGAAIWIPPTKNAAAATTSGDWRRVLSLSRLVIADDVPTNGASFLLSRSTRIIEEEGKWDVLVTYADEWQGHTGSIYRACGWEYVGMTKPERTYTINGVMRARKSGPKTRTHAEMVSLGAEMVGSFSKHKFVKRLRGSHD